MSIIFSAITFLDSNTDFEFIVGGNALTKPSILNGLKNLIINTDDTEKIVNIRVYKYGNGKHEDASPESLKCINMLKEIITDFLDTRCQLLFEITIKIPTTKKTNAKTGGNKMNESMRMQRQAERNKILYPSGTRIELIHMDDPYSPVPDYTRGTVKFVDDAGQLHMTWDNGRTLAVNTEVDTVRKLTMEEIAVEEAENGHDIGYLGDECMIVIPNEPINCSELGYFDELEEECWDLVKSYCEKLGIKMIPDEDGNPPISFDIAKDIQDTILEHLDDAGVEFNFDTPDEVASIDMEM